MITYVLETILPNGQVGRTLATLTTNGIAVDPVVTPGTKPEEIAEFDLVGRVTLSRGVRLRYVSGDAVPSGQK